MVTSSVGHIRGQITLDRSDWRRGFQEARQDMQGFSRDAETAGRDWQAIGSRMETMGSQMMVGVTAPILAAGGAMLKFAGDSEAATARMGVTFGDFQDDMMGFLTELQDLAPASMNELQRSASSAMGALVTLGVEQDRSNDMTKEALEVAANLSAHMSIPFQQALDAVSRGYAGNTQSLRDMAFNINQAMIETKALEMGLIAEGEAANGAARAIAVHNLVLDQMGGEFMNAAIAQSETFNFQLRQLWANVQDAGAAFGEVLLPAATQFIAWSAIMIERLQGLDETTKRWVLGVAAIAAAIGPTVFAIGKIISLTPAMAAGLAFMTGPAAPLVIGAIAVAGGIALIASNWDDFSDSLPGTLLLLDGILDRLREINRIGQDEPTDPSVIDRAVEAARRKIEFDLGMVELAFAGVDVAILSTAGQAEAGLAAFTDDTRTMREVAEDNAQRMIESYRNLGVQLQEFWNLSPGGMLFEADIIEPRVRVDQSTLSELPVETRFTQWLGEVENKHKSAERAAELHGEALEKLGREVDALTGELDDLSDAADTLRGEIERTGDPTGELTELLGRLVFAQGDLGSQINETNLEIARQVAETQSAVPAHEAFAQAVMQARGAVDEQATRITNLANIYDFLHGQVSESQAAMGHWESMASDAEKAHEMLTEAIERNGGATAEQAAQLETLEWWLGRTEGGIHDLGAGFIDSVEGLAIFHRELDLLNEALEAGEISQDQYDDSLADLNQRFEEMTADPLVETLDGLGTVVGELTDFLRELMIELGILDDTEAEFTISVDDREAIERTASMQDRADTLAATEIYLIPTVDEDQAVEDVQFLEENITNIPQTWHTEFTVNTEDARGSISILGQDIGNIPKSFTITPDVNLQPYYASLSEIRNTMPQSPAREGPLAFEPDWAWLFEGLGIAAAENTDQALQELQRLTSRIQDAWSGPDSGQVAGAILTGLEDDLSRIPEMVGHITPEVLFEFEIMRAGIKDRLHLAEIMGDADQAKALRSQLDIIGQLAIAWAHETGVSMGEALGEVFDAERMMEEIVTSMAEQQAFMDMWQSSLGQIGSIIDGSLIQRLEAQLEDLNRQMEVAFALDLPWQVRESIHNAMVEVENELLRAGEIHAAAYAEGFVSIDIWRSAIGELDSIIDGSLIQSLEDRLADLNRQMEVAFALDLPWQVRESIHNAMVEVENELIRAGEMHAAAYAEGLMEQREWETILATLPQLISGTLQESLEAERDELAQMLAFAIAGNAPDFIIEELQRGLAEKEQELADVGEMMGVAIEAGLIEQIEPLSAEALERLMEISGSFTEGGRKIMDAIIAGIEDGRMDVVTALELLGPDLLAVLERLETQLHLQLAEAIISDADIAEIEARIDIVRELMEGLSTQVVELEVNPWGAPDADAIARAAAFDESVRAMVTPQNVGPRAMGDLVNVGSTQHLTHGVDHVTIPIHLFENGQQLQEFVYDASEQLIRRIR